MQKRILGRIGWAVSVIGFGAIKLPRVGMKECEDFQVDCSDGT
jgi:aryl-alcohol dehydrogenase-like predicted oxidoreductase